MVRLVSRGRYTAVSLPKDLMDVVEQFRKNHPERQYRSNAEYVISAIREKLSSEENIIKFPKFAKNDRKGRDKFLRELEKSPQWVQEEFMKQWWGKERYEEIKSGNIPPEKFIKDNLGMIVDDETGKIIKVDPSLIKRRSPEQEYEILVSIEKRLSAIEKKMKK